MLNWKFNCDDHSSLSLTKLTVLSRILPSVCSELKNNPSRKVYRDKPSFLRGRGGLGAWQFGKKPSTYTATTAEKKSYNRSRGEKNSTRCFLLSRLIFDVKNKNILAQAIAQLRSENNFMRPIIA